MGTKPKILIIDDEPDVRDMMSVALERQGYTAVTAQNGEEGLKKAAQDKFAVAIVDINMPGIDGIATLGKLKKIDSGIEVIMATGYGTIESAIESMRQGAFDYLNKPFHINELTVVIEKALEKCRLKETAALYERSKSEHRLVTQRLTETGFKFPLIIQKSQSMQNLLNKVEKVASSNTPVLILGESGAGKDFIARIIHQKSPRSQGPFFTINCAGFTSTLLESELFGHEKGSFTGADKLQHGLFEVANGGTVFMDEIGDLSLDAQSKILRLLESGEFRRVGGAANLYTDIRLIASSNQDVDTLVKTGKIRHDLYYRINAVMLRIPSLRERKEDIRTIAEYFLKVIGQEMGKKRFLSQEVIDTFESFHWPGNVRQLRNTIESLLLLTENQTIQVTDLPAWIFTANNPPAKEDVIPLEEIEKQHILKVLKKTQGNRREAVRLLGISEPTLYRKLKEYGITDHT